MLVADDEVAAEALTGALQGLVQISKTSGEPLPTAEFERLNRQAKILSYLLGRRAASILGFSRTFGASADELAAVISSDAKTAREYASRMTRRFLARDENGYHIPTAKIRAACEEVNAKRNSK